MADGSARGSVERLEPTKAERAAAPKVAESKATIPRICTYRAPWGSKRRPGQRRPWSLRSRPRCARRPRLNGAYRDGAFETYSRINVGVVADDADGLVVPTIFDADQKDQERIAVELESLEAGAADGSITAREVAGGTFTLARGSGYEGCAYLPVINAGQAANLGIGSPRDGSVSATVAADARMISGPEAASFLALIQAELRKRTEPE